MTGRIFHLWGYKVFLQRSCTDCFLLILLLMYTVLIVCVSHRWCQLILECQNPCSISPGFDGSGFQEHLPLQIHYEVDEVILLNWPLCKGLQTHSLIKGMITLYGSLKGVYLTQSLMMIPTFYNLSKVSHNEMLKFCSVSFFASCSFYEIGQKKKKEKERFTLK